MPISYARLGVMNKRTYAERVARLGICLVSFCSTLPVQVTRRAGLARQIPSLAPEPENSGAKRPVQHQQNARYFILSTACLAIESRIGFMASIESEGTVSPIANC